MKHTPHHLPLGPLIDNEALSFKNTSDLEILAEDEWVGQSLAKEAVAFGLRLRSSGFNLIVLGEQGSGRKSLTQRLIQTVLRSSPAPNDIVLIYQFDCPDKPLCLLLPAKKGQQFRAAMDEFVRQVLKVIPGLLEENSSSDKKQTLKNALDVFLDREFDRIRKTCDGVDKPKVLENFLAGIRAELNQHYEIFSKASIEHSESDAVLEGFLARFKVNLLVDNTCFIEKDGLGAPLILDHDPSLHSLFGGVETGDQHAHFPDFLKIKAGHLLKANGGVLMLYLRDICSDSQSGHSILDKLYRSLRNNLFQVDDLTAGTSQSGLTHSLLDPIPIDVKLVVIASRQEYYALQAEQEEFAAYFQVKVDFADSMPANLENYLLVARLIARFIKTHQLKPMKKEAVIELIRGLHREIDDQKTFGTQFSILEANLLESAVIADQEGAEFIELAHVRAANRQKMIRHHHPEAEMIRAILTGEVMINVSGEAIGQINALTHIDLGDMSFGSPVRISARCYAGGEGVINIDREVAMTGPTHDKGLMILRSWLSATFRQLTPLSLTASLVFEQEYHGVEGDSASCAELYALLSALSDVPIKQGIAITGAMNQHGEVMAIGGINEKIEGYFRICKSIGLDKKQGVIIPKRNLSHLVLNHEVVDAISQGQFHLYAIDNVFEGIELLTGVQAGDISQGRYPENSLMGLAEKQLESFRQAYLLNQPIHFQARP
jgi:predicted ATP-dependent protease